MASIERINHVLYLIHDELTDVHFYPKILNNINEAEEIFKEMDHNIIDRLLVKVMDSEHLIDIFVFDAPSCNKDDTEAIRYRILDLFEEQLGEIVEHEEYENKLNIWIPVYNEEEDFDY